MSGQAFGPGWVNPRPPNLTPPGRSRASRVV
jgi:hypothetical protein